MDPGASKPSIPFGRGIVLFSPGTAPARRWRRLVFVAVYVVAGLMPLWPAYSFFASGTRRVLGLPLSLVWIIFALLLVFGALLWLYRHDVTDTGAREP